MNEAEAILQGDRRALARGLSRIEAGGDEAVALLDAVWFKTGRARRIGVTGPPGAGKSTLVAGLVSAAREAGQTVGVVAVDPTSPFSGGALLGDRHRMSGQAHDEGVFVRSLASRGSLGGLSRAAPAALDLLDAAGFDVLIVETVGVGQSEVEVAATADTVAVVLSPESGDGVQAMKAGLLEIADVLCVNKADREGAEALAASLESMLDLREAE
ncbi:MAG: methylmalonyl Co-A mutase-associated GTPase MeaB, partial [Planctomycetota bacterium]